MNAPIPRQPGPADLQFSISMPNDRPGIAIMTFTCGLMQTNVLVPFELLSQLASKLHEASKAAPRVVLAQPGIRQ